ncbi:hypothetical protein JHK85_016631 [Glycine max]|nr:hypothetical protein JHK85_016631 [Glycine max]
MWVQAIGLFAQVTCAPEFGLPRPFNQRLLVLHVGGGAIKQRHNRIALHESQGCYLKRVTQKIFKVLLQEPILHPGDLSTIFIARSLQDQILRTRSLLKILH